MKKWLERILDPMKEAREEIQARQEEVLRKRIVVARYTATLAWNAKDDKVDKGKDKVDKKDK